MPPLMPLLPPPDPSNPIATDLVTASDNGFTADWTADFGAFASGFPEAVTAGKVESGRGSDNGLALLPEPAIAMVDEASASERPVVGVLEIAAAFSTDDLAQKARAAVAAARVCCGDVAAQEVLGRSDVVILELAGLLGEIDSGMEAVEVYEAAKAAAAAAWAVRNLAAGHAANCDRLGGNDEVVAGLVRLLGCGGQAAQCAAAAISNLCTEHAANQARFSSPSSREALVALLVDADPRCRSLALLAIRSLSSGHPDNQEAFGSDTRVTSALTSLLEGAQDCQAEAATVVQTLSAGCAPNKDRFGNDTRIVSGLVRALESGDDEGKFQACGAVKNLSNHPPNQAHLGDKQALTSALLSLLEAGSSQCQTLALGALQALCWDSAENKARIGGEARTVSAFACLLTHGGAVVPATAAAIHCVCLNHVPNQEVWGSDARIVGALVRGLGSECARERRSCALAFRAICDGHDANKSRIGSDEIAAALITAFAKGELPDRALGAAIRSLSEGQAANKERFGSDVRSVAALAKLLAAGGTEDGREAAATVRTLCDGHDANRERFGGDNLFLAALAEVLTSESSDGRAAGLIVAHCLCGGQQAAMQQSLCAYAGVLPALATILDTDEVNRTDAAEVIGALCAGNPENKEHVGSETQVLPCLIGLLSNESDDLKALAARVLRVLVDEHDENRIRVLRVRLAVKRLRELAKSAGTTVGSNAVAVLEALDVE